MTAGAQLLASILGQDLEVTGGPDGVRVFQIAGRVAKDRVISTVDPQARYGHKSSKHGFDGYKGHAAVGPDSEIVAGTTVSAGNAADAGVATVLIKDLTHPTPKPDTDGVTVPVVAGECRCRSKTEHFCRSKSEQLVCGFYCAVFSALADGRVSIAVFLSR